MSVSPISASSRRARRFGDRLANLLAHPDLVGADRRLHFEGRHAGVLTDRPFVVDGQVDVLRDDRQRLRRPRAGRFDIQGMFHRGAHIRRELGRRFDDEVEDAVEKVGQHNGPVY